MTLTMTAPSSELSGRLQALKADGLGAARGSDVERISKRMLPQAMLETGRR
jgi:hypothetical protein